MKKRVCVVGSGTQGAISAAYWSRFTDSEIQWIHDKEIPPASVGEGTTVKVPMVLDTLLGFTYSDLMAMNGTPKLGLLKKNWGSSSAFYENFNSGSTGIHFSASDFHGYASKVIPQSKGVTLKEGNVSNLDDLDADLIVDCTGTPEIIDERFNRHLMAVNSACVVQCNWAYPRFSHTLTIAMPHGWIFGIPLANRCSIGYLYNNQISSAEDIASDLKDVLNEYSLVPVSERTLLFDSYTRKENFSERIYRSGNASFFMEPLEATSLTFGCYINEKALHTYTGDTPLDQANIWYRNFASQIETVIMYHYFVGSRFSSDFWRYAQSQGHNKIVDSLQHDPDFKMVLSEVVQRKIYPDTCQSPLEPFNHSYGTWSSDIWKINLDHLGGITA